MTEIILASQNKDKARELAHALTGLDVRVLSSDDVGGWPEVEETGSTLEENALLKARFVAGHFGKIALADDTGLEVHALNGAPGIYSARFAGENASYADNVEKLLRELKGVPEPERTATFRCCIALVGLGEDTTVEGALDGRITEEPRGDGGFGYDPVVFVPEMGRTFAEMTMEEKRSVSHRGRALAKARALIEARLAEL